MYMVTAASTPGINVESWVISVKPNITIRLKSPSCLMLSLLSKFI